jgi:tungstate transport system permease protein
MSTFIDSMTEALTLLVGGGAYVWEIIGTSVLVSATAVALSAAIGIPLGAWIGSLRSTAGRRSKAVLNTGMSLPPVVVGLVVYLLLSRSGPLGELDMLYTRSAMVFAQTLIAFPLVAAISAAAVSAVPLSIRMQARTLGAGKMREAVTVVREARVGVIAAVVAGFGGVISEVGAVMLVGGNIEGSTRVMTTAIVLETRQGQFGTALALGLILLGIALAVNGALTALQHGGRYAR